jgi:hypothetical protein
MPAATTCSAATLRRVYGGTSLVTRALGTQHNSDA